MSAGQKWRHVGLFFSPSEALALSNTHVCLVAEALCAQLRGGTDDMRVRRASLRGHHFPISTQAQGSASQLHTLPPSTTTTSTPPWALSLASLFLHLLPGDTLIVPAAINTSLSMWQPRVTQSPSQRSHWPRDCEKVQQA